MNFLQTITCENKTTPDNELEVSKQEGRSERSYRKHSGYFVGCRYVETGIRELCSGKEF